MHAMDTEHGASRKSFNPHKSTRVGQTSMAAPRHAVVTEAPKAPELPPGQAVLPIWSHMLCMSPRILPVGDQLPAAVPQASKDCSPGRGSPALCCTHHAVGPCLRSADYRCLCS